MLRLELKNCCKFANGMRFGGKSFEKASLLCIESRWICESSVLLHERVRCSLGKAPNYTSFRIRAAIYKQLLFLLWTAKCYKARQVGEHIDSQQLVNESEGHRGHRCDGWSCRFPIKDGNKAVLPCIFQEHPHSSQGIFLRQTSFYKRKHNGCIWQVTLLFFSSWFRWSKEFFLHLGLKITYPHKIKNNTSEWSNSHLMNGGFQELYAHKQHLLLDW